MSKAAQICNLANGKRSNKEIAFLVECDEAYVRAALQRKRAGGRRPSDILYRTGKKLAFAGKEIF